MLRKRVGIAVAMVLALWVVAAPQAGAQEQPGVGMEVYASLSDDGILAVTQDLDVPQGGNFQTAVPLKVKAGKDRERIFRVTDVQTTGEVKAEVVDDQFRIDAKPGKSQVKFKVSGTVSETTGAQLFRYVGVVTTPVARFQAYVDSPSYRMGISNCLAGAFGTDTACDEARVLPNGILRVAISNLNPGERVEATMTLPPGTIPAPNAEFVQIERSAFALTPPVWAAFGVLAVGLLAAAGYLRAARRRDTAAQAVTGTAEVLVRDGNRVSFASPAGLLPGQAGVVVDESGDAHDVTATVIDLAVRKYLWFTTIADGWEIRRLNPADDQLSPYERTVYEAVAPADAVRLADLQISPKSLRRALVADAEAKGWLGKRRGLAFWLGVTLVVAGLVAIPLLALTIGHALVGVALLFGGIALLLAPRWLPLRTEKGRELVGQIRGLLNYLQTATAEQVPPPDRLLVFSRSLPFAVALGTSDYWLSAFANTQGRIDWFGGYERDRDLRRFTQQLPQFIAALNAKL